MLTKVVTQKTYELALSQDEVNDLVLVLKFYQDSDKLPNTVGVLSSKDRLVQMLLEELSESVSVKTRKPRTSKGKSLVKSAGLEASPIF